ncbi:hypothetical protein B0H16DRAFT_389416 [Mycena metata]|uniref:Uncharacterized protein n=1 Tax=Mycena metata TaxID=1033252 RepID=A0AAD7MJQ6_9AGAR|nr:hypothetical protein B0H16DRAFT_389416 [Mycena metata]
MCVLHPGTTFSSCAPSFSGTYTPAFPLLLTRALTYSAPHRSHACAYISSRKHAAAVGEAANAHNAESKGYTVTRVLVGRGCLVKNLEFRVCVMPTPTYAYASSNRAADAAEAGNAHNEDAGSVRRVHPHRRNAGYTRDLRSRGTPAIEYTRHTQRAGTLSHGGRAGVPAVESTQRDCCCICAAVPFAPRRRRHACAHSISTISPSSSSPPVFPLSSHTSSFPLPPWPPSLSPLPPSCTPAHNTRAAEWSTMCSCRALPVRVQSPRAHMPAGGCAGSSLCVACILAPCCALSSPSHPIPS